MTLRGAKYHTKLLDARLVHSSTTVLRWNVGGGGGGLVVMGGRSSVVRAPVAQPSDLGSISGDFPVLFNIPPLACVV